MYYIAIVLILNGDGEFSVGNKKFEAPKLLHRIDIVCFNIEFFKRII